MYIELAIGLGELLIGLLVVFVIIFLYFLFQKEEVEPTGYLLESFETPDFDNTYINKALHKWRMKTLGKALVISPRDQYSIINPTTPPGGTSKIYYGLCFRMLKEEFLVQKFDEWIEVSPVHAQYYQITKRQKEELENKIKQGLTSAAQAVSDYELIKHDLRKYQEFREYFKEKDEHSIKSVFVDQVDFNAGATGEGAGRLSMSFMQQRNIMPTIVQDFFEMKNEEDLDKNPNLKDLPTVEKNMLRTKWRAYEQWKKLFGGEVEERYKRIKTLVESRKKSISEYREWLKPYIARHKIIEEGFSRPALRKAEKTSFFESTAQATSANGISLWMWKVFSLTEPYRTPSEMIMMKPIPAYDELVRKDLIFNKKQGLVAKYPWITESWVNKKIEEIYNDKWLLKNNLYYTFFNVDIKRTNLRFADGTETEDADFKVRATFLTQNVLLVKCLELKAKQEELEHYIDELLGVKSEHKDLEAFVLQNKDEKNLSELVFKEFDIKEDEAKEIIGRILEGKKITNWKKPFKGFADFFGLVFGLLKPKPYESNISDRIAKFYLKPMGGEKFAFITGLLKEKMGYGE